MIKTYLDNLQLIEFFEPILIGVFLLALIISLSSFPPLRYIAIKKKLVDEPEERSEHTHIVPTLGGVAIYIGIMCVISFVGAILNSKVLLVLVGGMTILFFLGLKDDLIVLSARKKFIGQLIAAFLLITITDTRLIGFSNIFSVVELPYWLSIIFTLFVFILIINAVNLIDGIDGLAGSVALLASISFGLLFYFTNSIDSAIIAFALAGSLVPFLLVNFSKKNKMFMGDTGSMIIGYLLAFFAVRFVADAQVNPASEFYDSAPIISMAILCFPLLDTLRIFFIRIFVHKKSPFKADKNHIHHRLLELGLNHKKTTFMIIFMCIFIIALSLFNKDLEIHMHLFLLLLSSCVLFILPFVLILKLHQKKIFKKNQTAEGLNKL